MEKQRYCHLYYGMGKGKTSILNGMALRALGHDWKVKYYRFLKNRPSGENEMFARLPMEFVSCYHSNDKFFWEMSNEERLTLKAEMLAGYDSLLNDVQSGKYNLILIDELLDCVVDQLICDDDIIKLISSKHKMTELAFSGHQVNALLFPYFDLISEVVAKKHYFDDKKVMAREGIEF